MLLHGVDVTGSHFLSRPGVIAAAAFAARAHEGQMRLTKQPYITHCVETAAITESLLALSFYGEDENRWAAQRVKNTDHSHPLIPT
jgi:(p)ppGpp synthase/HD superfamily hydrolase